MCIVFHSSFKMTLYQLCFGGLNVCARASCRETADFLIIVPSLGVCETGAETSL